MTTESDDLRGDRFVSMVEHMVEPLRIARRVEVITGAGGRRRWSAAEKARITEEAMALARVEDCRRDARHGAARYS